MEEQIRNNKRIAKNTLVLYVRMIFVMLVSIYTSRVVLQSLGVSDYGIYNVVGGFVAMFSIVTSTLSGAISRFITFELGTKLKENLNKIFSTSISIQLILSLIVIILLDTIGLWFLNQKMVIDADRMTAANVVFQLSILSFVISLLVIPYNAVIVANERMSAFAWMTISDVVIKLGIAFAIANYDGDRLICYAALLVLASLLNELIYMVYCHKNFSYCKLKIQIDKPLLKEMFGFASWNFIGSLSTLMKQQGTNVLLNMFFGTVINAAQGITNQVNGIVNTFVQNLSLSINPQITKLYAAKQLPEMHSLMFATAKLLFALELILSLPIMLNTEFLLDLWLGTYPPISVDFIRLTFLTALPDVLSKPLMVAQQATGDMKKYELTVGVIQLLIIPISYIWLLLGGDATTTYIVTLIVVTACFVTRLFMLHPSIKFNYTQYFSTVFLRCLLATIIASILPVILYLLLSDGIAKFFLTSIVSVITSCLALLFIACTKTEREYLFSKVKQIKYQYVRS